MRHKGSRAKVSQNRGVHYSFANIPKPRICFLNPWLVYVNVCENFSGLTSSALVMGGELAFSQPFCSILGIIHGRFFEVQAGCKSNVSLGKRTRPLVHEVTGSFAVKIFSWFLFNGEFYTRKVLNVTYEDFDWHCVCAWILLHKLSRCRTAHFELSQSLATILTTWESTRSFYGPHPRRVVSRSPCIFNHKGSTFS